MGWSYGWLLELGEKFFFLGKSSIYFLVLWADFTFLPWLTPVNGAGLDGFFGCVLIRVLLDGWKWVTL